MVFIIFISASVISSTLNSPSSWWFFGSLKLLTNFCILVNTRVVFNHLEYFLESNTYTFAVNFVASMTTGLDCNLSFLSSSLSSATGSSFIYGQSFIGFCKNEGLFNYKSLEVKTSTVVPLQTRYAGFIFFETYFHMIEFVTDWISKALLATNGFSFPLLPWIHQSTFILSFQNVTTSLPNWNALTNLLANLNPRTALNSFDLGILVTCSRATFEFHMTKFVEIFPDL